MLSKLLSRIAPPNHTRDHLAVAIVARGLKSLLLLLVGGLVAGVYGVTIWDSRMGRLLVEIAAAAIVVGLLHAGSAIRKLQREMRFRSFCRKRRLALPVALADGLAAAERQDAPRTAESISFRIRMKKNFREESIQIFDCLMFDLLNGNPSLSRELRQIARTAQRNVSASVFNGTHLES